MINLSNRNLTNIPALTGFFPFSHVVWAAMEKIGHKELQPNMIADGSRHLVTLRVEGDVDGNQFLQDMTCVVTIGHEQEKSSSINPQVPELIAYILSKLNATTQSRILVDVPVEFSENGNRLPKSNAVLVAEARHLLKKLRQTKTVTARGPIRCEYRL